MALQQQQTDLAVQPRGQQMLIVGSGSGGGDSSESWARFKSAPAAERLLQIAAGTMARHNYQREKEMEVLQALQACAGGDRSAVMPADVNAAIRKDTRREQQRQKRMANMMSHHSISQDRRA